MDVLSDLTKFLHSTVREVVGCQQTVPLTKRNRSLRDGDFIIPLSGFLKQAKSSAVKKSDCFGNVEETGGGVSLEVERRFSLTPEEIHSRLKDYDWENAPIRVSRCTLRDSNVFLHVDRTSLFRKVLPPICEGLGSYLSACTEKKGRVCLHCVDPALDEDDPGPPLYHLRSLLICDHLHQLLTSCGYDVSIVQCDNRAQEVAQTLNLTSQIPFSDSTMEPMDSVQSELENRLKECAYVVRSAEDGDLHRCCDDAEGSRCHSDGERASVKDAGIKHHSVANAGDGHRGSGSDVVIDLRQYLTDTNLPTGSSHYSANISRIAVKRDGDRRIADVAKLRQHKNDDGSPVIHVVSYQNEFVMQQVDLLWRMLDNTSVRQAHLVHGGITLTGPLAATGCSIKQLFKLRWQETEQAFRMKYGTSVQGAGWDETVEQLAIAALKIEILSTTARSPMKLHVSDASSAGGGSGENKSVFVMYNCARLSTLFTHFEEAVKKGTYPQSLPSAEEIDFSTLTDEGEWELFFNFILPYVTVVQSTVSDLRSNKLRPSLYTHKICQFLHDLSRHLSSYYSRIHVLAEPREHLLPLMYARLYLLRATQLVMHHALSLLSIPPMPQL